MHTIIIENKNFIFQENYKDIYDNAIKMAICRYLCQDWGNCSPVEWDFNDNNPEMARGTYSYGSEIIIVGKDDDSAYILTEPTDTDNISFRKMIYHRQADALILYDELQRKDVS